MKTRILSSLAVSLLATLAATSAHATYKCVDEKGITHYGDTMPPQCAKKEITEMSKQGSVVKKYEAPLTPEQLKAQAEERERRRETDKKVADQKLRDQALIATYGSEREFDVARDKDLAGMDARKKTLQSRNGEVDKTLAKYQNEMDFYVAGKAKAKAKDGEKAPKGKDTPPVKEAKEIPPQLQQDYNRAKNDRESLDKELAKVDADRAIVIAKYDGEKMRWKKLKGGMPAGTLLDEKGEVIAKAEIDSQIVGMSTLIPGRPRGVATCDGKVYECSLGISYACRAPNIGGPGVNVKIVACLERR
ncbi:MAG: DUF4124 domain-containing protein [Betaproteobacteria bacterium]|nr:DUF4124 domain-containing protein [Betaproteobacteria bacterium]